MDRRNYLQLLSVLAIARQSSPQTAATPAAPELTKQQVLTALKLLGLEFEDAKVEMMLPGLRKGLEGYVALRKTEIPLDTEPSFSFHPGPPGRKSGRGPARFTPTRTVSASKRSWKSLEELAFLPVTELSTLVRTRQVSSADLTRMYLERMERYAPKLNCTITFTRDLALEQAARADKEIARGKYRGPLHGIPWGAKDLFATKGIRTTWGAEPYQDQMIDYDATVVERLRNAGAVLIAKLSLGALAMGGLWFGGMTKTPWNLELTSSGSSAGSASATAAGLVGFAIGTETHGSIVSPCIRCGVTGLRPTYGRVSRYGAMGLSWTMDKIGPICRGVEDCALVLNAIHGPDGKDRTVTSDPFHWEPAKPLSALRIGVLEAGFNGFKDDEKKVYDQTLADLRKAGLSMKPVEFSDEDAQRIIFLLSAEAAAAFDDITRDGRIDQLKGQGRNDWPNSFRTSRLIPAVEYIRAQRGRTLLMQKAEKFFSEWDVIVTPPFSLMATTNLTGHPQVVVPCGFVKGTPRGLSFLGRLYDEGSPLRAALAYQSVTGWHKQQPPLS